jgi:uncharacterized protein (DUF58 family)
MLTTRGWWFFVVLLAVLAAGLWTDTGTLVPVALTLLCWFLAAWLLFAVRLRLLAGKLRVARELWDERGPVTSLWAGRSFTVRVELHGADVTGRSYLRIGERLPFGLQRISGATEDDGMLSNSQPLALRYRVHCACPGLVRFDGLRVQVADIQGFFYHVLFVRDVRTYRVLPPLADVEGHMPVAKRHSLLPLLGTHRYRRPGTASELLDLRDYLPGDPPRTIAWKASARRDRLMTKEFESEVPVRVTLFVDTCQSVRIGRPGHNALARLVEIAGAVAQASMGNRDLAGLCVFDEATTRQLRPARRATHLVQLFNLLAEAAALVPATGEAEVATLLPRAYSLARAVYPDLLDRDVNRFPWWLPWLAPQPAYTLRRPRWRPRSFFGLLWLLLRRGLRALRLDLRQALLARLSARRRAQYRWRKQLAAVLSVRYGLAPGGLGLLLEDDRQCSLYLQRLLAEHQVPYPLPFYDSEGRFLFAAAAKAPVLASALLRAVGRGRDNELFVLLADFLEIVEHLGPVLAAVKVARARHHQVVVVCPWPPGVPPPLPRARNEPPAAGLPLMKGPASSAVAQRSALRWTTTFRFHRAFHQVRRTFARLGVPVLCARDDDAVSLILSRLERLRVHERGRR